MYTKGSQVIIYKKIYISFSVKFFYVLANSVDRDEMLHSVAFHQFSLFFKVRIQESLEYKVNVCTEDFLVAVITVYFFIPHILYKPLNLWIAFSCSKVANLE